MSLINDALKKAQRLRTEDPTADTAPLPAGGSGQIAKRGEARSANSIVLIGGGVLLLVLISVALTIYLLKRPTTPAAAPVAATAPAPSPTTPVIAPPADPAAVTPPVVAPNPEKTPASPGVQPKSVAVTPPAPQTTGPVTPPPKSEPAATSPAVATANRPATPAAPATEKQPTTPPVQPPVTEPAPSVASTPAVAAPSPASNAKADDRVTAYIEGLKVTGIRSSGTESRVLMNERVYRVNDFVDRTLGIRLTKVAVDSLTFSDANGVNYIKYF